MKIVVADGLAKEGLEKLKSVPGLDLSVHADIPRDELKKLLATADVLVVRSRTQVDADLLGAAPQLKLAIRAGIGLDNIDVPAATDRGVIVMNAPTGNIVTTAEHALALLFAVSRHVAAADASLRQGKWEKKKFQGHELRGKTLGVLGLGNIGKAVAERGLGLKMRVVGYDPFLTAEAAARLGVELLPLEKVLSSSDYVTVHVPLNAETRYLLGKDALASMKKGAFLINCARGGVVEEAALVAALESGHLGGAALDVFETEPLPAGHPLTKISNVVLTPHLGASTDEAQVQVGLEVAEQIRLFVHEGALKNAVNVPNLPPESVGAVRPYMDLCERVGQVAAQLLAHDRGVRVDRIRVRYEGHALDVNRELLTLSLLQGVLGAALSQPVNLVNVRKLVRERGLAVEESTERECEDFASLVAVELGSTKTVRVAGTLFGKGSPRIVRIDDFRIDAIPEGHLLYTRNIDKPGVIGALGTRLGAHGINIAQMHLGRERGEAIALTCVDSAPTPEVLEDLRRIDGMVAILPLRLPNRRDPV